MTHDIIDAQTVVFEETGEERQVIRDCQRCFAAPECYGCGVLSPSGVAHIVEAYADATLCGKDATGAGWWWPL